MGRPRGRYGLCAPGRQRRPALVGAAIVDALGLREGDKYSPTDLLLAHLRDRHLLLVLDNFEQVKAAALLVAELRRACPRLALLVISREVLRLRGEQLSPVAPLPYPDPAQVPDLDRLRQSPAVRLFVERTRDVQPAFALSAANAAPIAGICTAADGLPLTIELMVAQAAAFPPAHAARPRPGRAGHRPA